MHIKNELKQGSFVVAVNNAAPKQIKQEAQSSVDCNQIREWTVALLLVLLGFVRILVRNHLNSLWLWLWLVWMLSRALNSFGFVQILDLFVWFRLDIWATCLHSFTSIDPPGRSSISLIDEPHILRRTIWNRFEILTMSNFPLIRIISNYNHENC